MIQLLFILFKTVIIMEVNQTSSSKNNMVKLNVTTKHTDAECHFIVVVYMGSAWCDGLLGVITNNWL